MSEEPILYRSPDGELYVQTVASTNIRICLDGVQQSHVVGFSTNGGWLRKMEPDENGRWVTNEYRGLISAHCDFERIGLDLEKTTQASGSGEGTSSI